MYICCCNGVTDGQIKRAIETNEIQTLSELNEKFGIGKHCGKCLKDVGEIFNDCANKKPKLFLIDSQPVLNKRIF